MVYIQLANHTSQDIQVPGPFLALLQSLSAHHGSREADQWHLHLRTYLADPGSFVYTLLLEVSQDGIDGLPHLLLELGTRPQMVLDEGVQLLAGDLQQIWDHL